MHIKIVSPAELEERRTELVKKAIDIANIHSRNCDRFARRMRTIEYELRKINKLLLGEVSDR